MTQNKKKKAREEQNVKRRVYDALNVLIAAEVLRKSAKMVYFNEMGTRVFTRQRYRQEPEERQAGTPKEAGRTRADPGKSRSLAEQEETEPTVVGSKVDRHPYDD